VNRRIQYRFRLYVAGDAQNSAKAVFNLGALCRQYLANRHTIEIVDVFREPGRALEDGIYMTPTLVRLAPRPELRLVGTLSRTDAVLQALDLQAPVPPTSGI